MGAPLLQPQGSVGGGLALPAVHTAALGSPLVGLEEVELTGGQALHLFRKMFPTW